MSRYSVLFGSVFVFLLLALGYGQESIGKITFKVGDNFIQPAGRLNWQEARFYMAVHDKDRLKTGKQSRCEIQFNTKKVMRIGENSVVEITKDKMGKDEVKMSRGMAWISLFWPKGQDNLVIRTPTSVCAIRGTVYRLESDSNKTEYRCYEGELEVTPFKKDRSGLADTSLTVKPGESLILVMNFEEYKKQQEKEFENFKKQQMDEFERFKQKEAQEFKSMVEKDLADFKRMQGIAYKKATFDAAEDAASDWVQWNKERDKLLQRQ